MHELFMIYLARRQLRPGQLITHRFDPRQPCEAYEFLHTHRAQVMGALFAWRPSNGHA